ncbi:MAG: cobalamin-dependent protein [Nitrospirae bacterium]|nr:cobalamin-dependent protein [Nitrospirota bacterium]
MRDSYGADIVFINPGDRKYIYQELGSDYSAIEPPFWIAAISAYLRNNGYDVAVIDINAESITSEELVRKVEQIKPLLIAVIVYSSQPSASTQNMTIAENICKVLKEAVVCKVAMGGLHPSALPEQTLKEEAVDFVIEGEGQYTLMSLIDVLKSNSTNFAQVPGLWYHDSGEIKNNPVAPLSDNLCELLPVAAWDLLPMDKYKAHNWHCFDNIEHRVPYGAIYTSLGCPYGCIFCCINALYGKPGIRFRSPEIVLKEITLLVEKYNIHNLKIIDELFVLNKKHYMAIVDMLVQRGYGLNIWAYARVDTIEPENLKRMKLAGINWLALGIESANPEIRDGVSKRMRLKDIKSVVRTIQDEGIRVIGNYMFGLPDDTLDSMQETLDMSMDLNCEFANFYCAMAYPGSKLYEIAVSKNWQLPKRWADYSQHSYEMISLPTKHISAVEVLKFRDDAFHKYFENPSYLMMIESKFGIRVRKHIEEMTKTRLKRRLLEEVDLSLNTNG